MNIYDLMIMNEPMHRVAGLGIYHTGVEVYGREYSYAGHYYMENTGLKDSRPRDTSWLNDAIFRFVPPPPIARDHPCSLSHSLAHSRSRSERIYVGQTKYVSSEVRDEFKKLQNVYLGPSYNVLDRNCNHFTENFVHWLTGSKLPDYVNRIMDVAKKVRVCLPTNYKKDLRDTEAPPEYESHKRRVPQPLPDPPDYQAR